MFVRPLSYDSIRLAQALRQLDGFVWLDSAVDGDFSIMAFCPDKQACFSSLDDKAAFTAFLKSTGAGVDPSNSYFSGGWIGYLSYECYGFSPLVPFKPAHKKDYPLAVFHHYNCFVNLDHKTGKSSFVSTAPDAEKKFREFEGLFKNQIPRPDAEPRPAQKKPLLRITPQRYAHDLERIQTSLQNGDYFELNYTAEFSGEFHDDPFELYLRLRSVSPAPFMAYLNFGDLNILSASPECFFEKRGNTISVHPIKGTAARGTTLADDAAKKNDLLTSAKDAAELLMVTDMLRNDLGRICEAGSVTVTDLKTLATFSHYHHLVSRISGRLNKGISFSEIFTALFPGGSITGAPKIKVMEHIDALENRARGIYTGAIGFISDCGNMEFNIPIRTMTILRGELKFAVGSGIISDSRLENEYQECLIKAKGLLAALEAK